MEVTTLDQIDSESFKEAAAGAVDWYKASLVENAGMTEDDAQALIDAFQK